MKLVTLMDGSRDGQLAVVSRDLTQAHFAAGIATTMRQLLDDWNFDGQVDEAIHYNAALETFLRQGKSERSDLGTGYQELAVLLGMNADHGG